MKKSIIIIVTTLLIFFLFTYIFIVILSKNDNDLDYSIVNENNDNNLEKAYIIKDNNLYITYDSGKTLEKITDYENFEKGVNNIYINDKKIYGAILLYKKLDENTTYIFIQTDMAMSSMFVKVYSTQDNGITYNEINVNNQGFLSIKTDYKINFINKDLIFILNPLNGGDNSTLYVSKDGLRNVTPLDVLGNLKNNKTQGIRWEELYDYYEIPTIENNIIYLNIIQGNDSDVGPYKYIRFKSNDFGDTWEFIGEFDNGRDLYKN